MTCYFVFKCKNNTKLLKKELNMTKMCEKFRISQIHACQVYRKIATSRKRAKNISYANLIKVTVALPLTFNSYNSLH